MNLGANYQLGLSVFYAKQRWSKLLKDCINTFLASLKMQGKLVDYYLHFCEEQGEHLRLTLQLHTPRPPVMDTLLSDIRMFLKKQPIPAQKQPLPLNTLFLDLETNAVYVNAYKPYIAYTPYFNQQDVLHIRRTISDLICTTFANEEVNKENLFNFFLQTQLIALSIFPNWQNATSEIDAEYLNFSLKIHPSKLVKLEYRAENLIQENTDELSTILGLAQGNPPSISGYEWLEEWLTTCKQLSDEKEPMSKFRDLSMLICEQLNFYHTDLSALCLIILNRLLIQQNNSIISHT